MKIVNIEPHYLEFLYSIDARVPKEHKETGRRLRPFVGVVFSVDKVLYFAPLSSPKPKHLKLPNKALDIYKIDNGSLGVINFINMVPVKNENVIEIDINALPEQDLTDKQYKNLLVKQIICIRKNENQIKRKAKALYNMVVYKRGSIKLLARCCDFAELERAADLYKQEK